MSLARRWILLAAAACAAAVLLADGESGPTSVDPENPCLAPVAWRVGTVDPRFGMTRGEDHAAVERAVATWERAAARPLFRHEPRGGMPIDLVYDHRQVELERRIARLREVAAAEAAVARLRDEYARKGARLQLLVARHNAAVEDWNRGGGGAEQERRRLENARREIDALGVAVDRAGVALQEGIARYNALVDEVNAGPRIVQAGKFEETVRETRRRRTRTAARLTVYQFEDTTDLVRVLAHELGHALGLGHVPDPSALMTEEYSTGGAAPAVAPADLEALAARCGAAWRPQ